MFKGKTEKQVDLELFTIFDSKTESYREPALAYNQHDFIRQISNAFEEKREQNGLYANAEDYSVFKIGEYSKVTGKITAIEPTHVVNLHELRAMVEKKSGDETLASSLGLVRQAVREELLALQNSPAAGPGH